MKKNVIIGIISGIIIVIGGGLAVQQFIFKKNIFTETSFSSKNATVAQLNQQQKKFDDQMNSMQEKFNNQIQALKSQNITIDNYNIKLKDSYKINSDAHISLVVKNIGKDAIDSITKDNIELKLGNTILPSNELTIDSSSSNGKYNPNQEYEFKIHFTIPKNLSDQSISIIFNINGKNTTLYPFIQ